MYNESTVPLAQQHGEGINTTSTLARESRLEVSLAFHNILTDIQKLIESTTTLTGAELERARARLDIRVEAMKASVEEMGCDR